MSRTTSRKRSRSPSWANEVEAGSTHLGRASEERLGDDNSSSSNRSSRSQAPCLCDYSGSTTGALVTTERIVSNIAAVHEEVVQSLVRQRHGAMLSAAAHTKTMTQLYERLATTQTRRAEAVVESLALRQQVRERETTVSSLQRRLEGASREAVTTLWSRLQILLRGPLAALTTQLNAEQKLRDVLCDGVEQLSRTALALLKSSEGRALDAELLVAEQRMMLVRVQAAYRAEKENTTHHAQEMTALQRLVKLLASRVKSNEADKAALAQAKAHVRLLEKQLSLPDIAAAVAQTPRQATIAHSAATAAEVGSRRTTSNKVSGPAYDALRLLERRDMTVAELVQSWCEQEARIAHNTAQQAELERSMAQLRHDALVAHQRCLDEQRRRALAERRVAELLRERLPAAREGGGALDLARELQELRGRYSAVCEDAAQLAVSLEEAREQQAHAERTTATLRRSLAQAEQDATASDMACVVATMRRQSQERWRELRRRCVDAETQCQLMTEVAEARGAALRQAEAALALVRRRAPQDAVTGQPCRATRSSDKVVTAAEEGQEVPVSIEMFMHHAKTLHGLLGTLDKALATRTTAEAASMRTFAAEVGSLVDAMRAARPLASADGADAACAGGTTAMEHRLSDDEQHKFMRQIVTHALRFAVRQVAATDAERGALLETALADADCVQLLRDKLQASETRVVALQDELRSCQCLIERNHLTVVQDALQAAEAAVAPAAGPDAAETADQLVAMQDELAGLRRLREEAAGQLDAMTERQRTLESEVREQRRVGTVAAARAARVAAALQSSRDEAVALRRQNVELSGQLAGAVRGAGRGVVVGDVDEEAAALRRRTVQAALVEFEAQLQTIVPLLLRLRHNGDATTAAPSASDGTVDGEVSQETSELRLALRINRGGLKEVAGALQEAVAAAGLLQGTLREVALRDTAALVDDQANEADTPAEVRLAALQLRYDSLQTELQAEQAERRAMCDRLAAAEELTSKAEEKSRRILDISKSLLDKQNRLTQENRRLREQLALAQPCGDAETALPSPAIPDESCAQAPAGAESDSCDKEE